MSTSELTRRDGVELARSGSWALSTGTWRAEPGDFAAAIAATACPAIRRPYLRVGHTDSRFGGDGEPAVGWIENLRLADGGNTLVGDLVGVPSWLNDVMASAYPDRSIEGAYGRRCALNHTHPFVLDGLALLGVTRPGVGTLKPIGDLGDVRNLFAPTVAASSDEVRIAASIPGSAIAAADAPNRDENKLRNYWVFGEGRKKWKTFTELHDHIIKFVGPERAKRIAASWFHLRYGYWPGDKRNRDKVAAADGGQMPNPQPSLADRVKDAWNASGAPFSQHVHQVRAGTAIVLDEADRSFWRVPVTVDGDTVTFGQRERVMPDFVDYDEQAIAASTTFATREESRPSATDAAVARDLDWRMRPAATVLDSPSPIEEQPPNPIQPVEPAPPGPPAEPAPGSEEPHTPPPLGGVPASGDNPGTDSGAEPVTNELEGDRPVSTLSADVRSRLGLTDDADDAAVVAALEALKTKADTPSEPSPEQVAASAAARDEMKAEITRLSTELASIKASSAADAKKAFFDQVVTEGRIAPADRAGWEARFDRAPDVIREVLASIAPNTAVPVQAAGYTGTGDESNVDDEYEQLVARIDGPYAAKEA